MLTEIQFERQAVQTGEWIPEELPKAFECFRTDGCLWLKGVFPPAYLNELCAIFLEEYGSYLDPGNESHSRAHEVGDKRLMVPVRIKASFNNPALYAHPLIRSFMKQALGGDFKLG